MKRKTIRNKTKANFEYVCKCLEREKGYTPKESEKIAAQLFETLQANPGGNIWIWFDMIIPARENDLRETARHLAKAIKSDLLIMDRILDTMARNAETREKAERLKTYLDKGMVTIDEIVLMAMGFFE